MTRTRTIARAAFATLVLTLFGFSTTAATAGAACRDGVERTSTTKRGVIRTAAVLCGAGGRRTVERSVWRGSPGDGRGTRIVSVARRGDRVATASLVRARGERRPHAVVRLRVARTGRVLFRHATPRTYEVDVVLASHGELAWTSGQRLLVRSAGKVRVRAASGVRELALEDGDTLRWGDPYAQVPLRYLDLHPAQAGEGCQRRAAFTTVLAETPDVLVRQAQYPAPRSTSGTTITGVLACVMCWPA